MKKLSNVLSEQMKADREGTRKRSKDRFIGAISSAATTMRTYRKSSMRILWSWLFEETGGKGFRLVVFLTESGDILCSCRNYSALGCGHVMAVQEEATVILGSWQGVKRKEGFRTDSQDKVLYEMTKLFVRDFGAKLAKEMNIESLSDDEVMESSPSASVNVSKQSEGRVFRLRGRGKEQE